MLVTPFAQQVGLISILIVLLGLLIWGRWRYDILRALDYFRWAKTPYDPRMDAAFEEHLGV